MRERRRVSDFRYEGDGITPADAGKTMERQQHDQAEQDHPR